MTAYYNEHDPNAAAWLRQLIIEGLIAPGVVDERSIRDVEPVDLAGFTQCHFFAGIGVWSHALGQAGWANDRPVWTGSCPCQPFSAAGKGGGTSDDRHLWPELYRLISQCRPPVVFGEQVASKDGLGWLDLVHADMERANYAFGAADLCAAGVGAPHIRQRLYFVADTSGAGLEGGNEGTVGGQRSTAQRGGSPGRLADTDRQRCLGEHARLREGQDGDAETDRSGQIDGSRGRMATRDEGEHERVEDRHDRPGPTNGHWRVADWLLCRDGKWRPVEPGTFPLAHGAPARVGRLRGYGNAIVAPLAQAFIESYLEC